MEYDFTELAKKQLKLDEFIKNNSKVKSEDKYWKDRIIALMVELSEVSNEIRFFKFWSKKEMSKKEIILDELVDCLHFAFSLGNTVKNNNWKVNFNKNNKREMSEIYFDVVKGLTKMIDDNSIETFYSTLKKISEIAFNLNYNMNDIVNAYNIKNKINYERQSSNY